MISAEEKEKSILNYMQTLSLTREEAEQLWNDDNSDELLPEQQELEEKAKKNLKRQYEINPNKVRKKVEKERTLIQKSRWMRLQVSTFSRNFAANS